MEPGRTTRESKWLDYSVSSIVEAYDYEMTNKEEAIKNKKDKESLRTIRPLLNDDYQREFCWTTEYQAGIIISIFEKYPIPAIYIDRKLSRTIDFLIDGRQRVETIWRFKNNKFPILWDGKSTLYKDLEMKEKNEFLNTTLRLCVCTNWPKEEIRNLFLRLQNTKPLSNEEKIAARSIGVLQDLRKEEQVKKLACVFHDKKCQLTKDIYYDTITCIALMVRDKTIEHLSNPVEAADLLASSEYPEERRKKFSLVIERMVHFFSGFRDGSRIAKTHINTIAAYFCLVDDNAGPEILKERGRIYDLRFVCNSRTGTKPVHHGAMKNYINLVRCGSPNGSNNTRKRLELLKDLFLTTDLPEGLQKKSKDAPITIYAHENKPTLGVVSKKRLPEAQKEPRKNKKLEV